MTKKFNQYLGKAGHLAVMSEFLMRGWNVAIPEVDIGDDIFVVQDDNGTLRRVQVKTCTAVQRSNGVSGTYNVSLKNLRTVSNILVHYVFIARSMGIWLRPIIIRQDYLLDYFDNKGVGSESRGNVTFYFSFTDSGVSCSGEDFSGYLNNFNDFPQIEH